MKTQPEAPQDSAPPPVEHDATSSAPDATLSPAKPNGLTADSSRLAPARRTDDFYFNDGPDEDMDDGVAADVVPVNGSSSALFWLGILALLCCAYALGSWATSRSSKPPLIGPITASNAAGTPAVPKLVVHVAGRVRKPGVYTLRADARVADAVKQAGGPLRDADVDALNLAAWVEDGARIEVPTKTSLAARPTTTRAAAPQPTEAGSNDSSSDAADTSSDTSSSASSISNTLDATPPEDDATALARLRAASPARRAPSAATRQVKTPKPRKSQPKTIAGMPRGLTKSGKPSNNASPAYLARHPLDLNTASAAQLEALPGVGPAMAQKMLAFREQNGGFKSVDDLDEVPGIGEKKLETLRPLVMVK